MPDRDRMIGRSSTRAPELTNVSEQKATPHPEDNLPWSRVDISGEVIKVKLATFTVLHPRTA
jgi:hypothetical protein